MKASPPLFAWLIPRCPATYEFRSAARNEHQLQTPCVYTLRCSMKPGHDGKHRCGIANGISGGTLYEWDDLSGDIQQFLRGRKPS